MRRLALAAVVVLGGLACQLKGPKRPYEPVGERAETLRAAFNAEAGRVRVVLLVEPT
jgi:hypothetical protein